MSNSISRRNFLKGIAASAAGLAIAGVMPKSSTPVKAESAIYTPGTYSASARGINSNVTVTMTFDETSILDVQIDCSGETEGIGTVIGDEMAQKILDAQGADIDAVSGATVTSDAIQTAARDCIAQATGIPVAEAPAEEAAASDWLGAEPVIDEAAITETIDCDVLVIGAGHSGTFAACAAVEEGAKTIVIERFEHDKASGIRDTLAACGSSQQKEDGADVDKNEAIKYVCDWSQGYAKRSLVKIWAEQSGEAIDWYTERLKEADYEFRHEIDEVHDGDNYKYLNVGHSIQYKDEYWEQLAMDKLFAYAEGLGLEVHYETTMVKLEKDGDRVTGIIATKANGDYVRYNAAKGVIVAAGGYGNNMDMMKALQPHSIDMIGINYNKAGSRGDGIKACLWAGAIMDTMHTSMIFDRAAILPDQEGVCGESTPGAWFWMGSQPFLKVNLKGERFMNEYQPYDYVLKSAAGQPHHTFCSVWDDSFAEDIERFATHGCSRIFPHDNGTAPVFDINTIMGMNAGLEADGYIVTADTLEELAEKLNIPADTFLATVERYNALAEAGADEDFGKESYRLSKLDTPPYHGARQCGGYFICTMDGIQIDDNMHALDANYEAIPGLYVIGDCSGNFFNGSYPNLMSGLAAGRSTTFGRIAGKNAAKGI